MKISGPPGVVPTAVCADQPCNDTMVAENTDTAERVHTRHDRPTGVDAGAARKHLARALASAQPLGASLEAAEALADLVRLAVLQPDEGLFQAHLFEFSQAHATPALAPLLAMRASAILLDLIGPAADSFTRRAAAIAAMLR